MITKMILNRVFAVVMIWTVPAGSVFLRGKGASFPDAVYKNWIPAYTRYRSTYISLNMDYEAVGSGNGKAAIIQNIDIEYAGSDTMLSAADQASNPDLVTFPTMAGAVVLAYKLPGLDDELNMTREVVVGIYNGTIRWWNDSLIQNINPLFSLPYERIKVLARADKSGTTSLFTEGLSSFSAEWSSTYGSFSTADKWDPNVITYYGQTSNGVSGILLSFDYSIGYLSVAAATELHLKNVNIENTQGIFKHAATENVQDAMNYYAQFTPNLTFSLHNAGGKTSYPIAGFTHFIVYKTQMTDCSSSKELVRYIDWFMTDSLQRDVCETYGMTPLSDTMVTRVTEEVLKKMTCQGQVVWDLVQADIENENKKEESWITIVAVVVPLFILIIIAFSGYILYQNLSFYRRIYNNDWFIPIEDIVFFFDKRVANSLRSKFISGATSIFSFQSTSQTSEDPELITHILQWPAKWGGNTVGLRLTTTKQLKKINRPMKEKMLIMKDKILHNNIVRFFGLTELEEDNYVIGEYCGKGQLVDLLQNEKFEMTKELKLSLALDLAHGMNYLHSKNIIHGKLSSSTCLIDSKWTIKVCDWEFNTLILSKNENAFSVDELKQNDPKEENEYAKYFRDFWTAPEIIRMEYKCKPTNASDVFSYAIVLQEIYTREDPYAELVDDMSPQDVIHSIVQVGRLRPKPSDDMPLSVRQCMEISWGNDPIGRPSFEQVIKMIRRSSPTIKTVLDSMMEAMEDYTHLLEERIDAKTVESSITIQHLQNLLYTYVPPSIVTSLTNGQTVPLNSVGPLGIIYVDIRNFTKELANAKHARNKEKLITNFHQHFQSISEEFSAFLFSITFSSVVIAVGLHSTDQTIAKGALKTAQLCTRLHSVLKRQRHLQYAICGNVGQLQESVIESTGRYQLFGAALEVMMSVSDMINNSTIVVSDTLRRNLSSRDGFIVSEEPSVQVNEQTFHILQAKERPISDLNTIDETTDDSGIEVSQETDNLARVDCH